LTSFWTKLLLQANISAVFLIDSFCSRWAATILARKSTEYAFICILFLVDYIVPHNIRKCCIKGFGRNDFYGGNGTDILELTPGRYSVGRRGATVTFTRGSSLMLATEFEQLIAGGTTYDFTTLTEGQTIFVA
jgi:hypothetical protein